MARVTVNEPVGTVTATARRRRRSLASPLFRRDGALRRRHVLLLRLLRLPHGGATLARGRAGRTRRGDPPGRYHLARLCRRALPAGQHVRVQLDARPGGGHCLPPHDGPLAGGVAGRWRRALRGGGVDGDRLWPLPITRTA